MMWSSPNYIIKVTIIQIADRPDIWSKEERKTRATPGISVCKQKNGVTTSCDD